MDGRQHDFQRFRPEHHRRMPSTSEMRQQIRVPFPRQPCPGKGELVDGSGRNGGNASVARVAHRITDGLVRGAPGLRRQNATLEPHTCGRPINLRLTDVRYSWIVGGFARNFRPDARRVTCRDSDDRFVRVHADT